MQCAGTATTRALLGLETICLVILGFLTPRTQLHSIGVIAIYLGSPQGPPVIAQLGHSIAQSTVIPFRDLIPYWK